MGVQNDENVSFRYPGSETPALDNVSIHIKPGESLAIVGENGSGKTTLIKLLTRLYKPSSGRILFEGLDLEQWDIKALRNKIGVIFSEEMLIWARGSRDTDGNWGKYWYKNVVNSTGFNQYKPKTEDVPAKYQNLYEECLSLYNNLHNLRIK